MESGSAPDRDDVAALEAVWGRRASATAPGSPRPDLDALRDAALDPGGGTAPRRRRRGPVVVAGAAALAVVALVAAVAIVRGGADEDDDGDRADPPTTVAPTGPVELGPPMWAAPLTCRPAPDAGNAPICPVATDDERAYVLAAPGEGYAVRAHAVDDGTVVWEAPFPEGAATVRRLPSTVLVLGVGPDWLTVALDPVTGVERWRAPGVFIGPIGRDHVLLDELVGADIEERGRTAVLDAVDGRVVVEREGTPASIYVHPCDAAGLALVRQDGRLTAVGVPDGAERWSIPVTELLDFDHEVHCDERTVAYVDGGTLHLIDALTGLRMASRPLLAEGEDQRYTVRAVTAGTVVVGSPDGARGFRAETSLDPLWRLFCRLCGPDLPVGGAGSDVVVLIGDQAVVRSGADGTPGPTLDLDGDERVLADGTLLAWGGGELVWADTADLDRRAYLAAADVRQAAAGSSHLVVTTADEVRAYPREG